MIKAVFFDLDGTIRHNLPSGGEVFAEYCRELGLLVRDEDRLRAMRWEHFYWANSRELMEDRRNFDSDVARFWDRYARRRLVALGASSQQALELAPKVNQHMMEAYKPESVVPEDVRRVLPELRENGRQLAVISNRDKPYQAELDALGLAQFFDFALAGGEVQAFKPAPEIFLYACRRLSVVPGEAAYVGDNFYADVVGARRAGLVPVLYDPRGIFPDPGCASIGSFDALPRVLETESALSLGAQRLVPKTSKG
jgi:HAD superfamily hydrolase (TIGR01549 family)